MGLDMRVWASRRRAMALIVLGFGLWCDIAGKTLLDGGVDKARAGSRDTSPIRIWDLMPAEERDFITIVHNAKTADGAQPDEAKALRAKQLCALPVATQPADGWVGRVDKVDTDDKGRVFVSLRIAEDIYVGAWLVTPGDAAAVPIAIEGDLAERASRLSGGEWLRFFGRFVKSEGACLQTAGDTPDENWTRPRFVFQFTEMFGL